MEPVDRDPMRIRTSTTPMEIEPVIDYGKPLMNCLETLIHNERLPSQVPVNKHNKTIAVPLLAYCSSMEAGTIFAPDDPKNLFEMPFVPFFERNHDEFKTKKYSRSQSSRTNTGSAYLKKDVFLKPSTTDCQTTNNTKMYRNAKPMIHSNRLIDFDVSLVTNKKEYNSSANSGNKANHINKFTKLTPRRNVSVGLKTLITGNANQNTMNGMLRPNIGVDQRSKPVRQYINKKAKARLLAKNNSNANVAPVPIMETSEQKYNADSMLATIARLNIENTNVTLTPNCARTLDSKFATTLDPVYSNSEDATATHMTFEISTADVDDSDVVFVPYTQYNATVTPEAKNAQTDTSNYHGPIRDSVGTMFEDYYTY